MSFYDVWFAARAALADHIETAWGAYPDLNNAESELTKPELPYFRLATQPNIPNQAGITPTDDQGTPTFSMFGTWARPVGETDLDGWAITKIEELRSVVAPYHHLGDTVTDCSFINFAFDTPALSANDQTVTVQLDATVMADYTR
jgi:hypothetical protein